MCFGLPSSQWPVDSEMVGHAFGLLDGGTRLLSSTQCAVSVRAMCMCGGTRHLFGGQGEGAGEGEDGAVACGEVGAPSQRLGRSPGLGALHLSNAN